MRRFVIMFSILFIFFTSTNIAYSANQPAREKLLEEALIVRYLPALSEVANKLFMCEKITTIKQLGGNREHELTIEVVTFEEAHMPPYDLIRVTLTDTPEGINVIKVERDEDLSKQQLDKHCTR